MSSNRKSQNEICFQCKKAKGEVLVTNVYSGWNAPMCVQCANFYTAFQANYTLVSLSPDVDITESNGYPYAKLKKKA